MAIPGTVFKYSIFDSGIRISDSDYSKASEFIKDKLKAIKVTAALGANPSGWTKVAIAFGLNRMIYNTTTNTLLDTIKRRYYFNANIENAASYEVDGIDCTDDSIISCWRYIIDNIDDYPDYGAFYRIFMKNVSGGSINGSYKDVTSILVPDAAFDSSSLENTLTACKGSTDLNSEPNKKLVVNLLSRTFNLNTFDVEANSPVFIPVERLDWVNNPSTNFFTLLGDEYNKLKYVSTGADLKPEDIRVYVIMVSISPEDAESLPVGTVSTVAIY